MSGGQKGTTKEAHLPPPLNRFKYRVLPLSRGFTHMGCCNGATVPRKISLTLWNFGRNPPQTAENAPVQIGDRKSTRLNSSHGYISYAVFCLKKKIQSMLYQATSCYMLTI